MNDDNALELGYPFPETNHSFEGCEPKMRQEQVNHEGRRSETLRDGLERRFSCWIVAMLGFHFDFAVSNPGPVLRPRSHADNGHPLSGWWPGISGGFQTGTGGRPDGWLVQDYCPLHPEAMVDVGDEISTSGAVKWWY